MLSGKARRRLKKSPKHLPDFRWCLGRPVNCEKHTTARPTPPRICAAKPSRARPREPRYRPRFCASDCRKPCVSARSVNDSSTASQSRKTLNHSCRASATSSPSAKRRNGRPANQSLSSPATKQLRPAKLLRCHIGAFRLELSAWGSRIWRSLGARAATPPPSPPPSSPPQGVVLYSACHPAALRALAIVIFPVAQSRAFLLVHQ
jgi:hypothetical protein